MKFNIIKLSSLLIAVAIGFGTAEKSLSQIVTMDRDSINSKTSVSTSTGNISFGNLDITKKRDFYDYLEISGIVHNHANKNWNESSYLVTFYDEDDDYLGKLHFYVDSLNKNQAKRISSQLFRHDGSPELKAKDLKKVGSYKIELLKGNFDTVYDVKLKKSIPDDNLTFEDDNINMVWGFNEDRLSFALRNKTDSPIKIDWNQVSYVDVNGDAEKVLHHGVKYSEKDSFLAPSLVPPTARIKDIILPTSNVSYISGQYGGWREIPMFPEGDSAMMYKGKSFSVFMPMEVNGEVKNYTFTFDINDVSH